MTTSMHRLQVSLSQQQVAYLAQHARRKGLSMAEVIRQLIEREAAKGGRAPSAEEIVIAEPREPYLITAERAPVALTLQLPAGLYSRLRWEARRAGKAVPNIAQDWLVERLGSLSLTPEDERELVLQVLRDAGLLTELGPELSARADPTISLEEVQAALDRAGGKPLSEIILEQRGPKG